MPQFFHFAFSFLRAASVCAGASTFSQPELFPRKPTPRHFERIHSRLRAFIAPAEAVVDAFRVDFHRLYFAKLPIASEKSDIDRDQRIFHPEDERGFLLIDKE